jgi:nitrite reductase/ring-hydroxylating ferredoxin subunit
MKPHEKTQFSRRDVIGGALALAAVPPPCCVTPRAEVGCFRLEGQRLILDLRRAPELRPPGGSLAIFDKAHQLNLLVAHVGKGRYAALDRTCTHGGAMCAYDRKRRTLRCTSLNHAEYDLNGTLLHGRTHGNLRSYPARRRANALEIDLKATV